MSSEPAEKTEKYTLHGKVTGAVCRFELTVEEVSRSGPPFGALYGGANSERSGFIVFADDGKNATYVELKDDKLGKLETITKVK